MIQLNLEFWALTSEFIGVLLIAVVALLVHHKIIKERHVDKFVIKEMWFEWWLGTIGIILIILGYILNLVRVY